MKRSLILTLLFSLVGGQSALAHDSLVGQFPAENQVLEAGIIEIQLDFSAELLAIEGSSAAEIVVSGPTPETGPKNNGCANLTGNRAIARVELDKAGTYQVGWRVVSADGHPISGSYEFQLENTTGYQLQGIEEIQCANPISSESLADQNQDSVNYFLLWISLPLIGVGLLLFLWPRKHRGNKPGTTPNN